MGSIDCDACETTAPGYRRFAGCTGLFSSSASIMGSSMAITPSGLTNWVSSSAPRRYIKTTDWPLPLRFKIQLRILSTMLVLPSAPARINIDPHMITLVLEKLP